MFEREGMSRAEHIRGAEGGISLPTRLNLKQKSAAREAQSFRIVNCNRQIFKRIKGMALCETGTAC